MPQRRGAALHAIGLVFLIGSAACDRQCPNPTPNQPAAATPVITAIAASGTTLTGPSTTAQCSAWGFPKASATTVYTVTLAGLSAPSDLEVTVDGVELPKLASTVPLTGTTLGFQFDQTMPTRVTVNPREATAFVMRFRNRSFNTTLQGTARISAPVTANIYTAAGSTLSGSARCGLFNDRDIPGGRIAFVSDRSGQNEVWIMNGDPTWAGSAVTQLSRSGVGFTSQNPVIGTPETYATATLATQQQYKSDTQVLYETSRNGGSVFVNFAGGGGPDAGLVPNFPAPTTQPSRSGPLGNTALIYGGNVFGYFTPAGSNPAATSVQQWTTTGTAALPMASPVFDPLGTTLVFSRGSKLRLIRSFTPPFTSTPLTNPAVFNVETDPSFSPDGTRVAYIRVDKVFVVTVPAPGATTPGTETRLGTLAGIDAHPVFTRDGSYVIYESTPTGGGPQQIFRVRADGTQPPQQLTTQGANFSPAASACCSNLIAFVSTRDGNREIYTMDINGNAQTNITNNPANDFRPYWR